MKDAEFAQANAGFAPRSKARSNFASKKVLTLISIAILVVGAMFGIGMLASYFGTSLCAPSP